jgi:hypothetical protein
MSHLKRCRTLSAALLLVAGGTAVAAESGSRADCAALARASTPTYRFETAEWVEASQATPAAAGAPGARPALPGHCLFRAVLDPRPSGTEDLSFGTGIELRLPQDWNGRLLFQGGGGLNGVLNPAIGSVPGAAPALARGFAVVSSDGGHRGRNAIDARFGSDQQAKLDFGWLSLQRATREAKSLLQQYYGRAPERSYFMGCSTGGREAMMIAQRLPLEFDGSVAGNPSWNLTRIAMNQVWSLQQVTRIAPRSPEGQPQLYAAIRDEQLKEVSATVLRQCDALDGLKDGLINDFQACKFDPASMRCGAPGAPGAQLCLSPQQVDGLKAIFGGARNSRGESLYGTYTYDTGIASPAWRGMHLGSATAPPANASLGRDTLRLFAMTPPVPDLDPLRFDFDRDVGRLDETAAINDPNGALHSTFAGRGGKLILYHGNSDQAMATGALTDWYNRLLPRNGKGPQDWARLYLVPGMLHCAGGQATDQFDMLEAIQQWVEHGRAPDKVLASGNAFPGRTRPLCPYPAVARYDGGDPESAASFSCR